MKQDKLSVIIFVILMLSAFSAIAAEMYIWVDAKGVKHITENPPEKASGNVEKAANPKTDPYEIQAWKQKQDEALNKAMAREAMRQDNIDSERRQTEIRIRQREAAAQERQTYERADRIRRLQNETELRNAEISERQAANARGNAKNSFFRDFWEQEENDADSRKRQLQEELKR